MKTARINVQDTIAVVGPVVRRVPGFGSERWTPAVSAVPPLEAEGGIPSQDFRDRRPFSPIPPGWRAACPAGARRGPRIDGPRDPSVETRPART